jgi:hypothetical protein
MQAFSIDIRKAVSSGERLNELIAGVVLDFRLITAQRL